MDALTLQQILDSLQDASSDVGALLSRDTSSDLDVLETEATTLFEALRGRAGGPTADDVSTMEQLADAILAIRSERSKRQGEIADRVAQADELAARIAEDAEEETVEEETVEEDDATVEEEDEEAILAAASPTQPLAAPPAPAARPRARVNLAELSSRVGAPPAPPARSNPEWSMVAAANVPGRSVGDRYESIADLAQAAVLRFNSMPRPGGHDGRVQNGLSIIRKEFPRELVANGKSDADVVEYAADHHRLPGGSLLAAGGWCAPSETLYDLVELEGRGGLIDLPEIVAPRGGVRWTVGPDFAEIFSNSGFIQTEVQAIAGTPKPCYEVPCEDFSECRLDAIGVCISAGILQQRAYPELVARTIRGSLTAHVHRYAMTTIDRMSAGSTQVALAGSLGAVPTLLGSIELQVWDYRYKHRMDPDVVLGRKTN